MVNGDLGHEDCETHPTNGGVMMGTGSFVQPDSNRGRSPTGRRPRLSRFVLAVSTEIHVPPFLTAFFPPGHAKPRPCFDPLAPVSCYHAIGPRIPVSIPPTPHAIHWRADRSHHALDGVPLSGLNECKRGAGTRCTSQYPIMQP